MQNYTENLQNKLHAMICEMAKHPENFCRNPGKDFIRTRKLPFEKVLSKTDTYEINQTFSFLQSDT